MTNTTSKSESQSPLPPPGARTGVTPSRSADARPTLQALADHLLGHTDFRAHAQGSGLALFAASSSRTAYLTEMVANAAMLRGGIDELTRQARSALGMDADVPADEAGAVKPLKVGDLHIDVTCDTGPALASLEALESTLERIGPKLDRPAVTLSEVTGAITACAGALTALTLAGGRSSSEQQMQAAAHLVALVERAKQLACRAE
ncbi:hypothetical protein MVI01_71530 [Myxococcus virescens]|nr:hypothetical protein MVI01_71530 [Myxococcus virescens]